MGQWRAHGFGFASRERLNRVAVGFGEAAGFGKEVESRLEKRMVRESSD